MTDTTEASAARVALTLLAALALAGCVQVARETDFLCWKDGLTHPAKSVRDGSGIIEFEVQDRNGITFTIDANSDYECHPLENER